MAEGEPPSHINVTGSGRPELKDLHNHVVMKVADKWRDLGVQLLRSDQEGLLNIIEANHPHDVIGCCKRLFEKWLEANTDATWNVLIKALRSPTVQLDYLASQLEKILITELGQLTASSGECSNICKLTSIDDIEVEFAIMTEKIKQALISSNVDVVALIEKLCAISAVSDKNVPLFDKDVFERMKSINEFWRELRIFWNIFDYDVLKFIVKVSQCKDAQVILDEFLSRIDPSSIEDVDLVLHCKVEHKEGSLKPVLRIKVNAEKCTISIKSKIKKTVSENFNLQKYSLFFIGIKKGCIELLYYVSNEVVSHFLQYTVDKNILAGLSFCNIISLHINDHVLKVSGNITDTTEAWSVDAQQEIRKPGQSPYHDYLETNPLSPRMTPSKRFDVYPELVELPEYKGLAVIIGNTYTRKVDRSEKDCKHLFALNGPRKDTEAMKEAFDYLRFLTIVRHDLTLDETSSLLKLLAQYRYPETCKRFVLTFSGHGGDGFVFCEDGRPMKIGDIVQQFSPTGNKSLAGVSRLFFFDACRAELLDEGIVAHGREGEWQSKIPSTGDVLVAYATTIGYKAFVQFGGGLWTSILAKKLVTSFNSVYDILTEVNKELIATIQKLPQAPSFQQPELLGRLNYIVNLLQESGQQPKKVEKEAPFAYLLVNPSISSRRSPSNDTDISKSPKSKLNEWCQSMKFSSPKYYQNQASENHLVITVSIMIEGQEVQYSYASRQVNSTKKYIKECEENAAEIAYRALTELYGTSASVVPPQRTQSYDEQTDPSEKSAMLQKTPSCPGFGSPSKKAKSQLKELFQKHKIAEKYSSSDDVTDGNAHNFRATLTYTVHGRRFRYESRGVFGRKQDAEEDAAQQALCEVEQQLKQPGGVSYKQLLKERRCDKQQLPAPEYTTRSSGGGFVSTVNVPQYKPVTGSVADSKKEAEQLAAMEALRQLKIDYQ